jgi:hypothetical protein
VTPAVGRSAAERGRSSQAPVGRRPQATHRQRAVNNGAQRVTITRRPEPRWAVSLEDTAVISLGTLAPGDAATLLARLAARPGIRATDAALAEITRLCGHAPWPPVRPDQRIGERDAAVFAAIARFCALVGCEYQRVGEPGPVRAANLHWLVTGIRAMPGRGWRRGCGWCSLGRRRCWPGRLPWVTRWRCCRCCSGCSGVVSWPRIWIRAAIKIFSRLPGEDAGQFSA